MALIFSFWRGQLLCRWAKKVSREDFLKKDLITFRNGGI
jgi:hypothetical protein